MSVSVSRFRWVLLAAQVLWVATASAQEFTLSLSLKGKRIEGFPLQTDQQTVRLLGRDGALWQFAPTAATNFSHVSDVFDSYSAAELKTQLVEEFGKSFDVSGTGNYLVVHPVGQKAIWAQRFEDMHREMVFYFTARRIEMEKPKFPLIAVVLPTQTAFMKYARQLGMGNLDSNTMGVYHLVSNRVLVFDTGDAGGDPDWEQDYSVVIHETAHQTAYNTGIHSRFGTTPVWVVEGVGTLFEARGVHNSHRYRELSDRINQYRFKEFMKLLPSRPENTLSHLIADDKLFNVNWRAAYANAWALTFYLSERETARYAEYLQKTARRPAFTPYEPAERLKDFTDVFGSDLKMFDLRMVRYISSIQP
ncbi:MAG: DUF1570 domain-containing protein [Planctomycetota bacterium]|nr:DUF1570 domain-containing protein [Planctomycetota bacterium]MDA1177450.1 DUF1570 domain-containing protein [Planctomycetota bacterium]